MKELTNLESKLAEVIGLAMASQAVGDKAGQLAKKEKRNDLVRTVQQMKREAAEAEKQGTEVAGTLDGKKQAILKEARATKAKAARMMSTYLDRGADALDAFEFMTMAEAGEVGHWSVLGEMNKKAGHTGIASLVRKQLPIQKRHLKAAQEGVVTLAAKEQVEPVSSGSTPAARQTTTRTNARKPAAKRSARGSTSKTSARRTTAKATTRKTASKPAASRTTSKSTRRTTSRSTAR